jgi:Fe2+ transport system protein FeoA
MPLGKLKEGDRAEIVHLDKGDLSLKLLEMGFPSRGKSRG